MLRIPSFHPGDSLRDWSPLLFVMVALVALAAVPYLGQVERQRLRAQIEVAESAQQLADATSIAIAHQAAAIHTYLLTRDERFLRTFQRAREQRQSALRAIHPFAREVDPAIEARLVRLAELVERWDEPGSAVAERRIPHEALQARMNEQQRLYAEILDAAAEVDLMLADEITEQRQAIRQVERRYLILIGLLSAMALVAAVAMGLVGRRLYRLRSEAERQAGRTEKMNLMLVSQMEESRRLNRELQSLNEELVTMTVAADSAREAAEHANRAKSDFLAVMSHELRTPLNAIAGYVDLMELEIHGPVTEAQAAALTRIKRNEEHLLHLINDILQFATLQAGKIEVRTADISAAEVIAGVEAMTLPQMQAKGLAYSAPPPDAAARVRGDPERINQILLNLIGNAVKFTPAGGKVAIHCEVEEDTVSFLVSDTGRGIPAHRLPSVFDPFVQVRSDSVDDPSRQGVGLGLAISRELARAMGGDLTARSAEGVGSTFTLTLLRGRRETTSILVQSEEFEDLRK